MYPALAVYAPHTKARPQRRLCTQTRIGRWLLAAALTGLAGVTQAYQGDPSVRADALIPDLVGSWRSPENRARDRYRHPGETLAFIGIKPNQEVIEITPGTGWFTEILAPFIKSGHGHYTAAVVDPDTVTNPAQLDEARKGLDKLRAKFDADTEHYGVASLLEFNPAAPVFGKPGSADLVLTFRNIHNWVKAGTAPAYFAAFFNVLKPGGVLGLEDHRAPQGSALNVDSGYLPEDLVIKLATDAGLVLDGKSEVNANPKDTKDYPKGVWTLPPVLILGEQDRDRYLAIGESDRFTLRFIKPAH